MNTFGTTINSTTNFCWKELTINKQKSLKANYSAQQQKIDFTQFGQILLDVSGSEIQSNLDLTDLDLTDFGFNGLRV